MTYRLKAFEIWKTMQEPEWAHVAYTKPDFQDIAYYAAPKQTKKYESWDDVDPELKETMSKLGISMEEQQRPCPWIPRLLPVWPFEIRLVF